MWKARNIILWWAVAALALLPTQEADAWSAARRRRLHDQEMRAKRRATQMAIVLSLKKDTISFEKEYLRQQLDNQLEWFFRQEWKEKLISFYWENVYKDKLAHMIYG